ncbi:phosphoglycolate phosphatase-like HAD superfamily hydrolase [Thalassospira sp. MBR-102]|jgi:phosphoglycolate phosphatase-like HAD superfamily hydrolase|uniref:HAD family hydrolase n=1 Tax=Thalassospira sp. MBR-102 TaxID=3156466 RepID=UPI00339124AD
MTLPSDKNLYVDFDGTLIDPSKRLYRLFSELNPTSRKISFSEYWDLKNTGLTQESLLTDILRLNPRQVTNFKAGWLSEIENPELLALDCPLPGAENFLSKLSTYSDLHLVTARQSSIGVEKQLADLGWSRFFKNVIVTLAKSSKEEAIKSRTVPRAADIIVGDTCEDICTGKALDILTVAVETGHTLKSAFEACSPDAIIPSVSMFDASLWEQLLLRKHLTN